MPTEQVRGSRALCGRARLVLTLINATNQGRKYNHQQNIFGREYSWLSASHSLPHDREVYGRAIATSADATTDYRAVDRME